MAGDLVLKEVLLNTEVFGDVTPCSVERIYEIKHRRKTDKHDEDNSLFSQFCEST
jgi:hypothetical protein